MGIIWFLPMVCIPLQSQVRNDGNRERKSAIGNAIITAIENAMVFALVNSHHKGRNKMHCLQMFFDIFTYINYMGNRRITHTYNIPCYNYTLSFGRVKIPGLNPNNLSL